MLVLVEAEEQKKQKQNVKLSQLLKDAMEGQCFGYLMKVSEITEIGEHHHHEITSSSQSVLKVCVNGLLMSKSEIVDESSTTLS